MECCCAQENVLGDEELYRKRLLRGSIEFSSRFGVTDAIQWLDTWQRGIVTPRELVLIGDDA
jgi:hypothetical protein